MAGYKMETSHAGRNCQKVDDVSPALSIRNRVVSIQPRILVDIVVAVAKLAVLGGGTALDAPWHTMRQ